ncbi:uncharacterized protein BDW70DRAFT_52498 [Aspergillus foveolatus]|uniref:uncharacterized protein n=1 Tax=Aspergillus foveolatus TaxID=210207 RepID=UPI003CCC9A90
MSDVIGDAIGDAIGDVDGQWPSRMKYHQNIEIRPYERGPIEEQTPPTSSFAQTGSAVAINTASETTTSGEVCSFRCRLACRRPPSSAETGPNACERSLQIVFQL